MYDKEEADDRFLAELDEDFKDDPDYQTLSRDEKLRIIRVMDKMMDMGMAAVYGEEEPDIPDADVPCGQVINQCKARCCTLIFALTKDEREMKTVYAHTWIVKIYSVKYGRIDHYVAVDMTAGSFLQIYGPKVYLLL